MYKIVTVLLFVITTVQSFAQGSKYIISGRIKNISTGNIYLTQGNIESEFFNKEKLFDSAKIIDGKFSFVRQPINSYTYGYRIYVESDLESGFTDLVFIAPGNQYLFIDTLNEYIAPIISNCKVQIEIRNDYNPFFSKLVKEANKLYYFSDSIYEKYGKDVSFNLNDSLRVLSKKLSLIGDTLLLSYVAKHPNSLVSLWKLIERFNSYGYKKEYKNIYTLLSKEMKNSKAGLLLKTELEAASLLSLDNDFPAVKLKNIRLKDSIFNVKSIGNKITFIDFWFSHCYPCLREFPKYKELHERYKDLGFSIVGISTDITRNIKEWEKIISDLKLTWSHYLDENGDFSNSVFIKSFPTNFLVDEKGKILAKNLAPSELELFLKKTFFSKDIYDKMEIKEPF